MYIKASQVLRAKQLGPMGGIANTKRVLLLQCYLGTRVRDIEGFSTDVLGIRTDIHHNCVLFSQQDVKFLFTAPDHKAPFSWISRASEFV